MSQPAPPDDLLSPNNLAPRPLSRLTYKIMSLNLIAVIVLGMGISYLGQYRTNLISAEMELLNTETRLYASILSENYAGQDLTSNTITDRLLHSINSQRKQQIRLFSAKGLLLKSVMDEAGPTIKKSQDPSLIEFAFTKIVDWFAVNFQLPPYPFDAENRYQMYPDVAEAQAGQFSLSAWRSPTGGLILSSSAPIKKNNQVIGVVLVTRWDTGIEDTFARARLDILRFVLVSLIMTISLSLYLAGSIGHPLRKLAMAAETFRLNRGRGVELPDMSDRQDEIGELSHSMREMTDALKTRLDTIERFAADVAHELKNPLTSLRSAIETLPKVKSEEDRHKLTDIALHDLQRMDRLITDISQASRLDAELSREVLLEIDLRDVLLPLIDVYRKPLERQGAANTSTSNIRFSGLDHPILVYGQPGRLAQVFQNLISNALSFSPKDKPVTITVEANADRAKITVDDEGPGIPENRLEKIFDRFYSERPATESFGLHSGLGLSIARQIMAAHNGALHAENRKDDQGQVLGARFTVRLRVPS